MWKGEYCSSGSMASMVMGPASGSRRIEYSDVSRIFISLLGVQRVSLGHEPRPRLTARSGRGREPRPRLLQSRLLLGQAVQRSQPPHEIYGMHADHLTV